MECFNCFQQGFCPFKVKSKTGKYLLFCSNACAQVQQREGALYFVTQGLKNATESYEFVDIMLGQDKTPCYTLSRKLIFTQMLYYKALLARKSKIEIYRLLDLFKTILLEMLEYIEDHLEEGTLLNFANKAKRISENGPNLIEILGS